MFHLSRSSMIQNSYDFVDLYQTDVFFYLWFICQGRDKDCIILSFVRSAQKPSNCTSSLLDDWHRINVALTRAKVSLLSLAICLQSHTCYGSSFGLMSVFVQKKLIMLGSCKTLSRVPLLKLLIEKVEDQSGIFCITRKDFEPKMELKRCSQNR